MAKAPRGVDPAGIGHHGRVVRAQGGAWHKQPSPHLRHEALEGGAHEAVGGHAAGEQQRFGLRMAGKGAPGLGQQRLRHGEVEGGAEIAEFLRRVPINLEYIYAFVSSQPNEAIVAMKVEDTEKAIKVFEENNAKILKKEDLEKI